MAPETELRYLESVQGKTKLGIAIQKSKMIAGRFVSIAEENDTFGLLFMV